ncbi:MAG TPA: TrkA C-terminal domain-containing protein, partial [Planctomycetota bacterium]|nr:TrkA C-terminal domain-containing protein [Planctomycetota bacterium]
AGKVLSVSIGAFLAGTDVRGSVQTGMSLAHIGEFSFLMASLGHQTGATGPELLPIVVAVATITTFLTPPMVRASERVALAVDRRLPRRVQTFVTLYGSWLEGLREPARRSAVWSQTRRLAALLVLDMAILAGIVVSASVAREPLAAWLTDRVARHAQVGPAVARWIVPLAALLAALPFCIGIVRCVRGLGVRLAFAALPAARAGTTDFADAPRRALVVCVQLLLMLAVVVPLLAVTQPFVPALSGAPVLLLVLVVSGLAFWRSATNLRDHVVAGSQMVVEALAAGAPGAPEHGAPHGAGHDAGPDAADEPARHDEPPRSPAAHGSMEHVERLLPGIGSLRRLHVAPDARAVGRSLRELDLRGRTGATVLAIARGDQQLVTPDGHERLRAGDVLALTGTHEAIDAAESLLSLRAAPAEP